MADRIKGITIEIGGDTTGLNKALSGVNKEIRGTQSQLKDVERLLKLDPSNTELLRQKQKLLADAVGETKTKLDKLKEANAQVAESANNYEAWKEKYDPIKKQIDETKKKLGDLKFQSADADEQLANREISQEKYNAIQEEIKQTSSELRSLQKSAKEVSDEFGNPVSPEQYDALQREIIETERQLKSLEDQAGKSNVALQKIGEAGEKFQAAGEKIKGAGEKLLPVTGAVVGIGAAAVKTTADFDSSMSKVKAISGATTEEFDQLRDKAREMGAETKYSASEAADAFGYMAMAGWKTGDMLSGIEGIMNLAAASGEDLATTSDIVTDALTAFGMTAQESGHFADVLAAASSNANTNVGMMGESFKYVAPLAGTLGFSAEDVAVALGIMANSGIKASQAGTSLRSALSRMAKPTKEMGVVMDEFGISMFNADGTAKSLGEIMDTLREEIGGCDESVQAYVATTLFGQEAMSGMLSIVNASEEDYKKLSRAVSNCNGISKEMADTMQDNLAGQLTILKSQLQEAAISIGDSLIPMIRSLVSKIQEWVDWYNKLSEGQKQTIITIGLVAAAIGPLLIVIGQMSTGIGAIMSAVSAAGPLIGALGAAGGPLLLAAAGFGILITAMSKSKTEADLYAESLGNLTPEQERNREKVEELYGAYAELDARRQEAVEKIGNQTTMEQHLWQELQNITDANGRVKEGYEERAKVITGQLSEALGIELEMTGNEIKNYNELRDSIDEVIQKKQANALLSANEAAYVEALSGKAEAYTEFNEAKKNVEETTWQMLKAQEEEARAAEEINRLWKENINTGVDVTTASSEWAQKQQEAAAVADSLSEKLTGLNQTLSNAEGAYVGYNTTIQTYEGLAAAIVSGDQAAISDAVLKTTNSFQTAETGTRESLTRQVADFQGKYAEMKAAVDAGAPGITAAQVENMGKLVEMSRAELDKLPQVAGEAIDSTTTSLGEKSEAMGVAGKETGSAYSEGMAGGITEGAAEAADAASDVAQGVVDASKTTLDSHSPSGVAEGIGGDFDSGLALGISSGTGQVVDAVNSVTNAAIGTLRSNLQASQTELSTFQGTTRVSWVTWANALVTELRTSLGQIHTETSTGLVKMQSTFSTYVSNIRKDWERQLLEMKQRHEEDMDAMNLKTTASMTEMAETVKSQTEQMKTDALTAMDELLSGTNTTLSQLEPTVRSGYEPAVKYITDLIPKARTWANDMMDGYIQGIREKIRELEEACEDVADTVSDYMHFTRPEKGPLRYYEEWMPHMMQGFAKGIRDNKSLIENEMKNLTGSMSLMVQGGRAVKQPVIIRSYNQTILDGQVIAESVNERLGAEL